MSQNRHQWFKSIAKKLANSVKNLKQRLGIKTGVLKNKNKQNTSLFKSTKFIGFGFVLGFVVLVLSLSLLFNSFKDGAKAAGETVGFVGSSSSGSESNSNPGITVSVSSVLSSNVSVNYSVSGGVLGTDYTLGGINNSGSGSSTGSITILAGQKSSSVPIKIINNSKAENNKVLVVSLTSVSGASLGSNSSFSYTVLDDDADSSSALTGSDPDTLPSFDYTGINSLNVTDGLKLKLDASSFSGVGDQYYGNNSLLLHGDGTNGATTTVDNSPLNNTVTFNGNAQISTAQNKFGGSSFSFDGNGDYLETPTSTNYDFGTGDFTMESWVYANSLSSYNMIFDRYNGGGYEWQAGLFNAKPYFYIRNSSGSAAVVNYTSTTSLNTNTWYHLAFTRESGTVKIWLNGVEDGSVSANYSLSSTNKLTIGKQGNVSNYFLNGYLDDIRITKGVARYTSNFTVPSAAFLNQTGTLSDGTPLSAWSDDSGNNNNATQSTTANQPVLKTGVLNGKNAVRFDGSDDVLNLPTNSLSFSSQQASQFVVLSQATTANQWAAMETGASNSDSYWGTNGAFSFAGYWGEFRASRLSGVPANQTALGNFLFTTTTGIGSGNYKVFRNGTNVLSTDPSWGVSSTPKVGGGYNKFLTGDIAEVLIYDRALNDAERKQVECYLSSKYGLSLGSCTNALKIRLDANNITGADGSKVSSWTDTSGNNINPIQNTSANQPTLKTGVNGINNRNVVKFTNSSANYMITPSVNIADSQTSTSIFTIVRPATTQSTYANILDWNHNNSRNFPIQQNGGNTNQFCFGGCQQLNASIPNLFTAVRTSTTNTAYLNGNNPQSTTSSVNTQSQPLYIGAWNGDGSGIQRYFNGDIAEVLIYDKALSDFERKQVECYLAKKYTLDVSGCASSGTKLWLDASAISGSDGSSISSWNDISGNGNNVTQSTSTSQPTLKTGANGINGKNVVRFDGNSDFLTGGDILDLKGDSLSLFTVSKFDTAAGGPLVTKSSARGLDGRWALTPDSGKLVFLFDDTNTVNLVGNANTSTATMINSGIISRNQRTKAFLNGSSNGESSVNSTTTNFDTTDSLYIGQYGNSTGTGPLAGAYLDGDIAEIIILNSSIPSSQRTVIESYLANKYGITVSNNKYSLSSVAGNNMVGIGAESDGISPLSGSSSGLYVSDAGIGSNGNYLIGSLGSGEYLMSGNDGGVGLSSSDLNSGVTGVSTRWNRTWGIDKTSTDGVNGKISFDFSQYLGGIPNSSNLSNYKLLYRSTNSGNFSVVSTNGNAFVDSSDRVSFYVDNTNLIDGYYTLGTTSESSAPISLVGSVSDLTATAGTGQVTLNWSPVSGSVTASDYIIQYSSDNFVNEVLTYEDGVSTNTSNVVVSGLDSNTRYAFRVLAVSGSGSSAVSGNYSNVVDATTTGGAPTINSISPNNGPTTGGNIVTINGSNFGKSGYKKVITLTNSGSALTNYEASLVVDTQTLISQSKMRSDCGDIRFTDSDDFTGLPYWIESGCNTTSTIVWVRVPSIGASTTKDINFKYGNVNLISLSDSNNFAFNSVLNSSSNNKALWLKATDGTNQTVDGASVDTWSDRSGGANNATQTTSTQRPQYKTNIFNGKPAVRFDGVDDFLSSPYLVPAGDKTMFVAWKFNSLAGVNCCGLSGTQQVGAYLYTGFDATNPPTRAYSAYGNGTIVLGTTPLATNTSYLFTLQGSGSNVNYFQNGLLEGVAAASSTNNASTPYLVGRLSSTAAYYNNEDIAEILVFNSSINDSDRALLETYLNNKYGLYGNQPTFSVGSEQPATNLSLTFGSNSGQNINIINTSQITTRVPANPTPGIVTLSLTVDSQTVTTNYEYKAPVISSVSPNTITTMGGEQITINGSNFVQLGYYLPVTVTNSGLELNNYQLRLNLDTSSLISYDKMQSDCSNLRIRDTNRTTDLAYFIESGCNSTNTVIWVKIPSLAANSTKTIYFYYGDNNLTSQSNADNVFDLYDDFTGTTLNTSKWNKVDGSGYITQNNKLFFANGQSNWTGTGIYSSANFNRADGLIAEADWRWTGGQYAMWGWKDTTASVNYVTFPHAQYMNNSSATDDIYENGVNRGNAGLNWILNQQYKVRVIMNKAGGAIYQASSDNGLNWVTWMNTTAQAVNTSPVKIGITNYSESFEFDNLRVRKYTTNEPTYSYGTESEGSSLTGSPIQVTINDVQATDVIFVSSTQITATAPAGSVGTYNIKVINPDGVDSGTSGNGLFTYSAPVINSVTPDTAATTGGKQVTINGNYFPAGLGGDNNPYRRAITLTNSNAATLTDYQVTLNLDTASLINAGKMRSDCADLNFNNSQVSLSFWIESGCNSSNTKVWVKVVSIPVGTSSINMTYGDLANSTSASSTTNVFIRTITGLVSAYNLDESSVGTANDTQNSNNATDNNTTTTSGKFGNARNFNGSNANITRGATSLPTGNKASIVAWIKPTGYNEAGYNGVVSWGTRACSGGAMLLAVQNTGRPSMATWCNDFLPGTGTTATTGDWNHIAVTLDTNQVSLYMNNTSVSGTISTPSIVNGNLAIGSSEPANRYFTGAIDEVQIYNRALSAVEISDLYNNYGYSTSASAGSVLVTQYAQNAITANISNTESPSGGGIKINNVSASNIVVVSPTQITVRVPANPVGSYPIIITNPDGAQSNTNINFNYSAPVVSSVNPTSGPTTGGNQITIAGNYFGGTGYYKQLDITSSESLTNYQISFTLDTADLINNNKMRSDCGDIRVKTMDETVSIPYFIESGCNTNNTVVWIKAPVLNIGTNSFKIVYGDPGSTSQSNSSNIFPFYDDFSGDLSKWTSATGSIVTSGGIVTINNGGNLTKDMTGLPADYLVESRYQRPSKYRNRMYLTTSSATGSPTGYDYGDFSGYGIFWNGSGPDIANDTWYQVNWENTPTNYTWKINEDNGTNIITRNFGSKISGLNRIILTGTESGASILKFDWIRVRAYSATQPTISLGSEVNTATKVYINNVLANGLIIDSETQLRVTTPANPVGTYPVKVVAPDGVESNTNITYTYAAPVVNSVTPSFGPDSGGTFVTISGDNFGSVGYYTVPFTITNPNTSALSNYQVKFSLNTASLISSGKLASDCSNIRIRDNSNNDLPYWIESGCNTTSTVIWTKVSSIGANSNIKLNLLYGFSGWSSQSNGDNVFEFFDGFDGSTLKSGWTYSNNGNANNSYSLSTNLGKLTLTTQNSDAYPGTYNISSLYINQPSGDWEATTIIYARPNANYSLMGLSSFSSANNWYTVGKGHHGLYGNENIQFKRNINGSFSETGLNNTTSPTYYKIRKVGSAHQAYWSNNQTTWTSIGGNDTLTTDKIALTAQATSTLQTATFDEFRVRKIVTTDLTFDLGTETAAINVSFGSSNAVFKYISSQTLTGYVPAGTGSVNVTVTNSDGSNGTSSGNLYTYGVNNIPNTITDLAITSTEGGNVGLSWSVPFDNGSAISDYVIEYSQDNFNTVSVFSDGVSTSNSTIVSGLNPGQDYQFRVFAVNSSNVDGGNGLNNSLDSNVVSVTKLDCDTDLNGNDLIISTNQTLTGRYCNINLFQVNSGITATLNNQPGTGSTGGKAVKIYANSANVLGTIDGVGKGYSGANQGTNSTNSGFGIGGGGGVNCSASNQSGGGYGGVGGGVTGGTTYGSISQPLDLGSGGGRDTCYGGAGGNGGGAIKIVVTNTLTNNGTISANGGVGINVGSGGSGGSVWLESATLAGNGTITANGGDRGGDTSGRGGGGGRIALYYTTKTFSGGVNNFGGIGGQAGGAGTIYEKLASQSFGSLRIDQNNVSTSSANTPINSTNFSLNTLDNILVTNRAVVSLDKDLSVNNTSFDLNAGTSFTQNNSLSFNNTLSTLSVAGTLTSNANINTPSITTFNIDGTVSLSTYSLGTINTLNVNATGTLTHKQNNATTATPLYKLDLSIGDLNIATGGKIDVVGKGYSGANQGTNSTNSGFGIGGGGGVNCSASNQSGGGYGGVGGGVTGGTTYGSISQPLDLGSGGGRDTCYGGAGGNGGGAIKIVVTNTLTNNGTISANGGVGINVGSGGSGGSVWLESATLAGNGTITANGGDRGGDTSGRGGGGGRIALYYTTKTFSGGVNNFGGIGGQAGGAGTIYEKLASQSFGSLRIDQNNVSTSSANTPINSTNFSLNTLDNILVTNRAVVSLDKDLIILNTGTFDIFTGTTLTNNSVLTANSVTTLTLSGTIVQNNTLNTTSLTTYTQSAGGVFTSNAQWNAPALTTVSINGTTSLASYSFPTIATLDILATGTLTHKQNNATTATPLYKLDLSIGDLNIATGGKIDVVGKGYSGANQGTNSTNSGFGIGGGGGVNCSASNQSGGGYGGVGGGVTGGTTYGSISQPLDLGSGGGRDTCYGGAGGNGGGAIKIVVTNTLTNNGTISANGGVGINVGSGGSGGSVWLESATLAGNGTITANGGDRGGDTSGRGGGGGRIALYYQSNTSTMTRGTSTSSITVNGGTGGGDCTETAAAAYTATTSGCTGTIYDPNTPESALTSITLNTNPNPPSVGSTFSASLSNVKNTLGFNLFYGTCQISVTGPGNYTTAVVRTGTVASGTCNLTAPSATLPAPDTAGTFSADISVTGNGVTETTTKTFTVYSPASGKALADVTLTTQPQAGYSVIPLTADTLIGTSGFSITASGFIDSGNNQALNGVVCSFNVTGPNSYSQTFNSAAMVGGSCIYTFSSFELPYTLFTNSGSYSVTVSVPGRDAGNTTDLTLTTTAAGFNRYFDVFLSTPATPTVFSSTGTLPGSSTSVPSTIALGNNTVITSPVFKKYDNSTLLATGLVCTTTVEIDNNSTPIVKTYNSTLNSSGQCVVTVPSSDLSSGTLQTKTAVSLALNSQNITGFETNYTTIPTTGFPSNLAKYNPSPSISTPELQPIYNDSASNIVSASPSFVGSSITLTISGLIDSANNLALGANSTGPVCNFVITKPDSTTTTVTSTAVSNGTCAVTVNNTQLGIIGGSYSFRMNLAGKDGSNVDATLYTPSVAFARRYDVNVTGANGLTGTLPGSMIANPSIYLTGVGGTATSPALRRFNTTTSIANGTPCRIVLRYVNSGNVETITNFDGTTSGGTCSTTIPGANLPTVGTAYLKTRLALFGTSLSAATGNDLFETAETAIQVKNANNSRICSPVFRDDNSNSVWDTTAGNSQTNQLGQDEVILTGVNVKLLDNTQTLISGKTLNTAVPTIGNPNINCFSSLFDDTYYLEVTLPAGTTLTTPDGNNPPLGVTIIRNGSNVITGLRYQVTLGVNDTQGFTTGLNASASICVNSTFVDLNSNGSYGGSDYKIVKATRLYLDNNLTTAIATQSTNTSSPICFSSLPPSTYNTYSLGYILEQDVPQSNDPDFLAGGQLTTTSQSVSGYGTITSSEQVSNTKARTMSLTLTNGQNVTGANGLNFGYKRLQSFKAQAQNSPNQTQPLNTGIAFAGIVNSSEVSGKIYKGYKFNTRVNGLIDSATGQALTIPNTQSNYTQACSITYSGPSFNTPQQAYGTITNGTCLVDPVPDNVGSGNTAEMTVSGDSGNLTTSGSFDVLSGNVNVCSSTFADYSGDGNRQSNEPYLAGRVLRLFNDTTNVEVATSITSSTSGADCFSEIPPGVTYRLTETAASGNIATTNSGSTTYIFTPNPEQNQNFKFGYQGNSTVCPLAFRDDSGNGIKDTNAFGDPEPYISTPTFTAILRDDLGNQVSSFSVNNTTCFTNLIAGNYELSETFSGSFKLGRTNFTTGSTTINSLGVGASVSREFGYINQATVCPYPTFNDYDKDGIQDSGEVNITGLTTKLIRVSNSTQIGSDLTITGSNCFTGIIPDTYTVEQTKPTGGVLTTSTGSGVTYSQTSTVASAQFTALLGVDQTTRFGYKGNATVCPYPTFRDINKNTLKDSGEVDIDGVTTTLKDGAGTTVATLLTNATTQTCFTEVLAGNYRVLQTAPTNTSSTTGGTDVAVDNLTSGESRSVKFGYNGDPKICPVIFRDDNSNAGYDNGEITLAGVTVTLKDASGTTTLNTLTSSTANVNCFTSLTAGTYTVQVGSLSGYSLTTVSSRSVTVDFGEVASPQFGYNGSGTICVDPTFKDVNGNGVIDSGETKFSGVNTYLKYPNGTLVVPLQTTDSNGVTCFTNINPGSYTVSQDAPVGSTSTTGGAQSVTLVPSGTNTLAFGYNGAGTLCANPTFDDTDFNGVKNTSESYISGVSTKLYLSTDLVTPIGTGTTNAAGTYCFTGLFPASYRLSQDLPSGYSANSSTTGGEYIDHTLSSGEYKTVAFGYTTNPDFVLGAIRGFLYIDRNENGVYNQNGQDAAQITVFDNDIPVTKAEVELYQKNTTTNNYDFVSAQLSLSDPNSPEKDGTYGFTGLLPGDYKIVIVTPLGTAPVSPNPSERLMTITTNDKITDQDFGFQYTARICPALFVDKSPRNNIFDGTDIDLIAERGAYYQLQYQSFNGTQVASNYNTNGYLINSSNPCIEHVPPRDYTLVFRSDLGSALSYGTAFDTAFYNQRTSNQSVTVYLGTEVNTSNSYYTNFTPNYTNSTISGRVWNNRPPLDGFDGNGYDNQTGVSGGRNYSYDDDFVYSGITMNLKKCGAGFGEVQADIDAWNTNQPTSVTDVNGYYSFPTVPPGTYAVIRNTTLPSEAALNGLPVNDCSFPSNYIFINNTYQYSGGYAPGAAITYDIITHYKASITNTLYIDQNHNGVYDSWETNGPVGGLAYGDLTLTNTDTTNIEAVQNSNASNLNPPYGSTFQSVPPGNYTIGLSESQTSIALNTYFSLVEYPSSCPSGYSQLGGSDLRFEFDYTYDANNRSGRFCIKDSEFTNFDLVEYPSSCPSGYSQLGGSDLRIEFDYTYDANNRSGRLCIKDSEFTNYSFVDYNDGNCPSGYSQLNNSDTRLEFDYTYDANNRSGRFCIKSSVTRTVPFAYPLITTDQSPKPVTVTTSTGNTPLTWGFDPTNNSTISGKVFIDRNSNNVYQADGADANNATTFDNDTVVPGATIQLYYGFLLDPISTKFVASTTSDSSGNYSFTGLAEGYYSARITTPNPAGTSCIRCDWGYNNFRVDYVYVNKDSTSTQNLRYNYNATLSLKAFYDTISNFVRDTPELDATGMKFTVSYSDGYTLGTVDPNPCCGLPSFSSLPAGTYSVNVNNIPVGITLSGGYLTNDTLSILPSESYTRDYPFTAFSNNTIKGYVFVDRNLDGNLQVNGADNNLTNSFDNEYPFPAATVRVSGPLGTYTTTTTTDTGGTPGYYEITGLPSGNYKVHTTGPEPDADLNDPLASQVISVCMTALDCKSSNFDSDGQRVYFWSGGQIGSNTITRGVNVTNGSIVNNNLTYAYTGTINARCMDDLNGDGSITYYSDTGYTETSISGCSFRITTPTGEYLNFTSNQNISATGLPPGTYTVTKLNDASGRINTNTSRRDITPNINLGSQSVVTNTFTSAAGSYQRAYYNFFQFTQPTTNNSAITGKVYIDKNQDQLYQASGADQNLATLEDNDILLPNIGITLAGTTPSGTLNRSTSTSPDTAGTNKGKYQFTDLPRGSFTITAGLGE